MFENYTYVFIFSIIGLGFSIVATLLPEIIAPKHKGDLARDTYESGMETIGSAWVQFKSTYYMYALIFIVFDVEVVFLFPALLAYRESLNMTAFGLIVLFLGILTLGIVYAIRKRFLDWK